MPGDVARTTQPAPTTAEVDLLLTAQIAVALAGEGHVGEEPRLGWWRSDLTSGFGARDLFERLLPRTYRWAVSQAVREAARRTDAEMRERANPDGVTSLYSPGFDLNEVAEERLLALKRGELPPDEALPGLRAVVTETWNPTTFAAWLDLSMRITTALRTRSARSQGDNRAIRGLLQLLGELSRRQALADQSLGALITLDQVYEVQYTALDAEIQARMARILGECAHDEAGLMVRAAKVVALLEQIQDDKTPTTAALVAQCLFERGSQVGPVTEALEELRRRNFVSYSEKLGYKIQSTVGEELERERRDLGVAGEAIAEYVQEELPTREHSLPARAGIGVRLT